MEEGEPPEKTMQPGRHHGLGGGSGKSGVAESGSGTNHVKARTVGSPDKARCSAGLRRRCSLGAERPRPEGSVEPAAGEGKSKAAGTGGRRMRAGGLETRST